MSTAVEDRESPGGAEMESKASRRESRSSASKKAPSGLATSPHWVIPLRSAAAEPPPSVTLRRKLKSASEEVRPIPTRVMPELRS